MFFFWYEEWQGEVNCEGGRGVLPTRKKKKKKKKEKILAAGEGSVSHKRKEGRG